MNCPKCGGTGYVPTNVFGVNGAIKCDFCDGTGVFITNAVEQTNEEWFDSLTTKKKAKIIKMVINICISCKEHKTIKTKGCLLRQKMAKNLLFLPCMDEDGICKWLKQPHQSVTKCNE